MVIPKQSNGNGGEVRAEQFLNGNPGVNPFVPVADFSKQPPSNNQQFNPGSVQDVK